MVTGDSVEIVEANCVGTDDLFDTLKQIYSSSSTFSQLFESKYPKVSDLESDILSTIKCGLFLVARSDNKILGFLKLSPQKDSFLQHTAFFSMGVRAEVQGKGVGKQLMSAMLDRRSPTIEIIYLMVRGNNERAIGLYEKFGFNKVAILPKDTKVDGKYFDGVLMSRSFIE